MIIKFKSLIMDEINCPTSFDPNAIQKFNEYFKGKYCYLVRGEDTVYAVAFNTEEVHGMPESYYENIIMTPYYFNPSSEMENILLITSSTEYWDNGNGSGVKYELSDIWSEFIDQELTEKSNSKCKYISLNKFEPDADLSINDIKRFRTWIADCLYERYVEEQLDVDEKFKSMVEYYRNEMNDAATRLLDDFTKKISNTDFVFPSYNSGCGCSMSNEINETSIDFCDAKAIYKKGIHDYMVDQFTNINLWLDMDDESTFLIMFKKYIDAIILNDFPLYTIKPIGYADCSCLNSQDNLQENNMGILKDLSTSIKYMIEETVPFHKNFIYESLYKWSNYLYEIMRW